MKGRDNSFRDALRTRTARHVQGERWPALMTIATLAAYLDCTNTSVETAVAVGDLPLSFKFGRQDMWSKNEIDEVIAKLDGSAPRDWRAEQPGLQMRPRR